MKRDKNQRYFNIFFWRNKVLLEREREDKVREVDGGGIIQEPFRVIYSSYLNPFENLNHTTGSYGVPYQRIHDLQEGRVMPPQQAAIIK